MGQARRGVRLDEEVIAAGGRIRDGRFRRWETVGEVKAALDAANPDSVPPDLVQPFADLWPSIEQQVFAALDVRGRQRAVHDFQAAGNRMTPAQVLRLLGKPDE